MTSERGRSAEVYLCRGTQNAVGFGLGWGLKLRGDVFGSHLHEVKD